MVGVLALPLATAGCTVPMGAVTGVGVNAAGGVVGYLQVCDDHIDGATLYSDSEHESDDKNKRGSWSAPKPVTKSATWTLSEPVPWATDLPLADLDSDVQYGLYGWTEDNSSSAGPVMFSLEDLASLKPGQVLYGGYGTSGDGDAHNVVVTEADFKHRACEMVE